jgi:hypothetical protein
MTKYLVKVHSQRRVRRFAVEGADNSVMAMLWSLRRFAIDGGIHEKPIKASVQAIPDGDPCGAMRCEDCMVGGCDGAETLGADDEAARA